MLNVIQIGKTIKFSKADMEESLKIKVKSEKLWKF
jgi:hypothetical protein